MRKILITLFIISFTISSEIKESSVKAIQNFYNDSIEVISKKFKITKKPLWVTVKTVFPSTIGTDTESSSFFHLSSPLFASNEKMVKLDEKITSLSVNTIPDVLKKSVALAYIDPAVFLDQIILPVLIIILNISADEVSANSSPCLDIARDNKFCDLIKDSIESIFQIKEPSLTLKHKILLSWSIRKSLSLNIFILDLNGTP